MYTIIIIIKINNEYSSIKSIIKHLKIHTFNNWLPFFLSKIIHTYYYIMYSIFEYSNIPTKSHTLLINEKKKYTPILIN